MPASCVALRDLSWSPPGGSPLFSHLDLTFGAEHTGLIGRNGTGKTSLLRLITGELVPQAGAVTVNGRFALLRQAVQPAEGDTVATLFGATEALAILQRAETGQATTEDFDLADWTLEARLVEALTAMGVTAPADTPLLQLSGGQRTRAALAALAFDRPDILLLDEPTNHLDADGRRAVAQLLDGWAGAAIVVSHDRDLLERMDAVIELTSHGARRYGGNWSTYRAQKALDLAAATGELAGAEKRLAETDRQAQQNVERQARRDGVGHRKTAKGDMPRIVMGRLKDSAEQTGGAGARLAERRRAEATDALEAARAKIEVLQPFTVALASTGLPPGRPVVTIDAVTAGYGLGRPVIDGLTLRITGPERVAITGGNGAGKTTLLDLINGRLAPWQGTVRTIDGAVRLDQDAALLDPRLSLRDNFRRLHPQADENTCRAALARFMFRADAALQLTGTLSGGQHLRAALACVLGAPVPPPLLLLDEPTNHLDIASVEAVEAGLLAYDGALVVVSHDKAFLDAIGITRRVDLSAQSPR